MTFTASYTLPPLPSFQTQVSSQVRCESHGSLRVSTQRQGLSTVTCFGERRSASRAIWSKETAFNSEDTQQLELQSRGLKARSEYWKAQETDCTPKDEPSTPSQVWSAAAQLAPSFAAIDRLVATNICRVQQAFAAAEIGPHHFAGSTGYGHGDLGRAALDEVMAAVMGTESAIVRTQFVSGTHAIATALFACLRPGDELLAVAGRPYDTLEEVIGLRGQPGIGSLRDWGVTYREVALQADGRIDLNALSSAVTAQGPRVALVQRSCGYVLRPTLTVADIKEVVGMIKAAAAECIVVVDNCYGEFTEGSEPGAAGADLVMGSLIKSPGGTIATGGGYIAGRRDLVAASNVRLTAPGIGLDSGCVSGESLRLMFQGLFLAPQMVGEALKGGRLLAEVFQRRGLEVYPPPSPGQQAVPLPSFITAIRLGSPQAMEAFCRAVQSKSPVGSYVRPVPGQTAGYGDEVIFADGTFIDGSTAELSADGPLREPYVVYCQGGTHWTHWAICLESILPALDSLT